MIYDLVFFPSLQNDLSPDNDPCVDLKSVLDMPMGLEDIVETTPKISRPQVCQNCSQSFESFAVLKSHRQESKGTVLYI